MLNSFLHSLRPSQQRGMPGQYLVDNNFKRKPIAPQISSIFNWTGWLIAVLVASLIGGLMSALTPFKPAQAVAMALIAYVASSLGHLVMKALKRDRGITNWDTEDKSDTGASGLLDRVDAQCFAAPVFFYSVR